MKNGCADYTTLVRYVRDRENKFLIGHCEANALRIWSAFGGEIHVGIANCYPIINGEVRSTSSGSCNHFWNVLTINGCPNTIFDAYNHTTHKTLSYDDHRDEGATDAVSRIKEMQYNARLYDHALARFKPLVEDGVITPETFPDLDVSVLFKRPVKVAHITSPARVHSLIQSGHFIPAYSSPHSADAGFNCFIEEHGRQWQAFSATGAELHCLWHGSVERDTSKVKLPYSKDTLWFDPTWRAFVPIDSDPALLQVVGFEFEAQAERDWYLATHGTLARWFLKWSNGHFRLWQSKQRKALQALIDQGTFLTIRARTETIR